MPKKLPGTGAASQQTTYFFSSSLANPLNNIEVTVTSSYDLELLVCSIGLLQLIKIIDQVYIVLLCRRSSCTPISLCTSDFVTTYK